MSGHFSSLLDTPEASLPRIGVTVLTGFLGSGKTTLLNRLLRSDVLAGVAVVVNEFGAVGIDHDLIADSREDTVLLANGCLCCVVRSDLVDALQRLASRTERPLTHVLIETSGLADPGPIQRTLLTEPAVRERFAPAGVACTVDAILAAGTLDRHEECVRQIVAADVLLLTKLDLAEAGDVAVLVERVRALNPVAEIVTDETTRVAALRALVQARGPDASNAVRTTYRRVGAPARAMPSAPAHREDVTSFVLIRDEPLPRDAFAAWLDLVIAGRGVDLLRVKGLVNLAEEPDRPLVVHGAQHLFHPPERLARWPSDDRRTRIVFITRGVAPDALEQTLDVLVRRHQRARARSDGQ